MSSSGQPLSRFVLMMESMCSASWSCVQSVSSSGRAGWRWTMPGKIFVREYLFGGLGWVFYRLLCSFVLQVLHAKLFCVALMHTVAPSAPDAHTCNISEEFGGRAQRGVLPLRSRGGGAEVGCMIILITKGEAKGGEGGKGGLFEVFPCSSCFLVLHFSNHIIRCFFSTVSLLVS